MAITLPKLDQQVPSGPGGVEIAGFPQILHTRAFGHPDVLFIPLLEGTKEAVSLCERLIAGGETRENAATMSGIQLASGLLKDSSFSLSARGMPEEHHYFVDPVAGTLSLQTRLYAEVSRRTSMIKLEIAGQFREGIYVVRSPGDSSITMQFDEVQMRQPTFFSTVLAEQYLQMQVQRDQSKRTGPGPLEEEIPEVQLTILLANRKIPVVLKQKRVNGEWDILEASTRRQLGTLSADGLNHLHLLFAAVSTTLAEKAKSTSWSAPAATPLVAALKDSSGS